MKSVLHKPRTHLKGFPKLMKSKHTRHTTIVLFTREGVGTVVYEDHDTATNFGVGWYSIFWKMEDFEDTDDTVELSNFGE